VIGPEEQRARDLAAVQRAESRMPSPEVVVQAEVAGMSIAFTAHVPEAMLDAYMDMVRRRIDRARAHNMVIEALIDLTATEEALSTWGPRKAKAIEDIVIERTRLRARYEQENAAGRRADTLTGKQQGDLNQFTAKIEAEAQKFDAERQKIEENILVYRDRVERQRKIIGGAERADMVGFHIEAVADAAE
jgi:hypothetical protein